MPRLTKVLPAEDRLVLLPKNPGALFVFWNLAESRAEAFRAGTLAPEVELRLFRAEDKTPVSAVKSAWDAGGAYLAVPANGGGSYAAALFAQRSGDWEKLLESNASGSPQLAGADLERACASLDFYRRTLE